MRSPSVREARLDVIASFGTHRHYTKWPLFLSLRAFWTHNLDEALKHPQILLYPSVDGKTFRPEQAERPPAGLSLGLMYGRREAIA
jgi:hypothetical protein